MFSPHRFRFSVEGIESRLKIPAFNSFAAICKIHIGGIRQNPSKTAEKRREIHGGKIFKILGDLG